MRSDDLPADVLTAAQRGDPHAIEDLYRRYAPAVLSFYRARVGDAHLAEDLTGDAFIAVLRALPSYQGGPETFAGWLFTVVRRDLVDHLRRQRRRPETSLDAARDQLERDTAPDAADLALLSLDRDRVRSALADISPDQREVLVLRVVAGLSSPEIAAATGRTVGAVKALQHRGLAALARQLGQAAPPYPRKAARRL